MFERLVQGKIEFTQLNRQRRLRPDIRELINPIYPSLQDHPSVRDRENVPGMGGINVWFHNHTEDESFDDATSIQNLGEATMIVGLFNHLVLNGVEVEDITVVTFYNGQRKLIVKMLKSHPNLMGNRFNVVTVDSYQGEENKIIILSLVRNNDRNAAGFTNVENRVCVALSRAKMGFYIFGNKQLIGKNSNLWLKVIEVLEHGRAHMDGKNYKESRLNMPDKFAPSRLGWTLPVTCEKHHTRVDLMGKLNFEI
jgi:helicase required for RNAi-mediated heterochromatin assembly 1